ncbi:MAG: CCA tRNA nucleotidyltransferase [Microbacteriaceae bacterium]|jgi:poly(A) polymerase|nr:CCA tRNA nucleotidyltransferase [Microbacteriaceae bacterium]
MQAVLQTVAQMMAHTDLPILTTLGEAFAKQGFELSLVGGSVRDAGLGRPPSDLDFTTNASCDEALSVLKPLSTAHWDVGRQFGTVGARVQGQKVEVTTYRADAYDHVTRKPIVAFGDNLEDDLKRRDFTVNALALRLPDRVLVDPFGGVADLVAGVLRTPGAPEVSFSDDPLRMLRGARFVSQLGFRLDPGALAAMRAMGESLQIVSGERIGEELMKLLVGQDPVAGLRVLVETGLADRVLPELPALQLSVDEHHRHKDVYEHSLTVLQQAIDQEPDGPDAVLRWAALLHDTGKPATRKFGADGTVSFHNHDRVGARLTRKRLRALHYDKEFVAQVSRLVELHMRFFGYGEQAWTDSAVRRYVRDAGPLLPRLHILTKADMTTRNQRKAARLRGIYASLEERIAQLQAQEELDAIRPDLDGTQIMEILGLHPGREVGEARSFLLELRLDEGPLGEAEAARRLREWWDARQS